MSWLDAMLEKRMKDKETKDKEEKKKVDDEKQKIINEFLKSEEYKEKVVETIESELGDWYKENKNKTVEDVKDKEEVKDTKGKGVVKETPVNSLKDIRYKSLKKEIKKGEVK